MAINPQIQSNINNYEAEYYNIVQRYNQLRVQLDSATAPGEGDAIALQLEQLKKQLAVLTTNLTYLKGNALAQADVESAEQINTFIKATEETQLGISATLGQYDSQPDKFIYDLGAPTIPDLEADILANATDPSNNTNSGLTGQIQDTRAQATLQDTTNFQKVEDWRVRLSLSPGADYLYKAENKGILAPLATTNGVVFPYTPDIVVNYAASYDQTNIIHSNYKIYQYQGSSIDQISITCDFTAQDTFEANYLLAVIHFFRSVTKMFYGQDENPKAGTPPPLCYLFGLGQFQFNAHPLVITNFNYTLPSDVDYIRAGDQLTAPGVNKNPAQSPDNSKSTILSRLIGKINPGGVPKPTDFNVAPTPMTIQEPTYVPTKIKIQLTAYPIISRNEISNNFSVQKYATGELLNGVKRAGGGFW